MALVGVDLLVMGVLGGGALNVLSVACASLATLGVLAVLVFGKGRHTETGLPPYAIVALGVVPLLPLLQLVPLPPQLWRALPGQAERGAVLDASNQGGAWQPVSLTPIDTAASALGAICFVTLVIALTRVSTSTFRRLAWLQLGLIALGLAIGVLQVIGAGWPQLHAKADFGFLIGFFANKNHMAAALAASLPLAWYLIRPDGSPGDHAGRRRRSLLIFAGYWTMVVAALVATNSRAGLALGMLTSAVITWRLTRKVRPSRRALATIILVGVAAAVMSTPGSEEVSSRLHLVNQDPRWQYLQNSVPLMREYWSVGSGIGSFSRLYMVHEPLSSLKPSFVNQAHNEYVQVVIEGGVFGIAALVISMAALVMGAISGKRDGARPEAVFAGSMIILIYLMHSFVDYPLRRPAGFAIFAMGCAMLWRQAGALRSRPFVGAEGT